MSSLSSWALYCMFSLRMMDKKDGQPVEFTEEEADEWKKALDELDTTCGTGKELFWPNYVVERAKEMITSKTKQSV